MKKSICNFVLCFFVGTLICHAQQDPRIAEFLKAKKDMNASFKYLDQLFPEWQLSKMKNLCGMVGSRTRDLNPTPKIEYMYTRRIYEAARVDTANDNRAAIAQKISAMWKVFEQTNMDVCNNTQFDVWDGSVLKYAVTTYFEDFIDDILAWKVPLNKVDLSDNRTLLDYIEYQMQRNKGNALEPKFRSYYNKFRAAGAKHKREL